MYKKLLLLLVILSSNIQTYSEELTESKYSKTSEVGYSIQSKEGIKLFINLEIKQLLKSTSIWIAVVIFETEGDSNFPLQVVKVVHPLEQNLVIKTPHLYSLLNNHQYKIRVLACDNLKDNNLITEHEQPLALSVESELLNQFGVRAL